MMNAVWLEDHAIAVRSVPVPVPPAGEALIRVRLAGICATDLELVKGYYPYTGVLGHEFVGEVAAAEQSDWVGKRVVGEINAYCHQCEACQRGDFTHCENRTVLGIVQRDGAFAPYLTLPYENLHVVPDHVPDEQAVFAEPLAAALEILTQIDIRPEDRVLLVGAGRLGQLIARVIAAQPCELSVSAKYDTQRELLEKAGIRWINTEEIQSRHYDVVIEATGSQAGFRTAQKAVRPRGTLVLKSTYAGEITVNFSELVVDEITLIGSRCGPTDEAVRWLSEGKVDLTDFIHARFGIEEAMDAFDRAAEAGVIKVLFDLN